VAILMALMSSVVWGSSDFIGGLVSRRLPAYVVVATSQAAGLAAVTGVALATGGFGDTPDWIPAAVVAGVSGAVGLVMFYTALATGTMGIVSPIAALGVLVPVAVGFLGGDTPSAVTTVGIAVALGGAVCASGPELRGSTGSRPVGLAALAAVSFGIALLFLARGAQQNPLMCLWGMRATSVAALAVTVLLLAGGSRLTMPAGQLRLIGLAGIGDATANMLFSLASLRGYLSVVSVLGSLYPVMTVLLARLVLQQRLRRAQLVGVVAALCGVVLVSLG
jgi:drug/metabolite transporter (DMT)-like permease